MAVWTEELEILKGVIFRIPILVMDDQDLNSAIGAALAVAASELDEAPFQEPKRLHVVLLPAGPVLDAAA